MRTALLAVPLIVMATSTLAEARPDSLRMSCAATYGLVQRSGAVVIGTGPNLYERFVTDAGYCELTQTTEPAWIPTGDNPQCLVGKRCIERRLKRR
ncbi:hypothetical protein G3545_06855 [Starkeya sp. ORNL1]|uniref:hypothetical protein n=1 Tax=Starkeya sp. ORNL1 TaxID=2709380 RepID=UPI0014628735|nr:hypothetical protein [Starkeya sp. ORNL1]QJP13400.1 hypothetical protein G3545_06855 [Starkeya sp. ORNL1]